jgi:pseudouridine-5'-phosphate glycosidase
LAHYGIKVTLGKLSARFEIHPDVQAALDEQRSIVALESTIISHGLPRPENLRVAKQVEDIVRQRGSVPATIALLDGIVHIGLDDDQLQAVAMRDDMFKVSVRDLAIVAARGGSGATTVAATSHIARSVGIKVFATGGLGGIHRHARESWDESADLTTLGMVPITVVCSGVKSILDVGATLERLETLNVGVLGYQTAEFPGFYLRSSGYPVDWTAADPNEVADVIRAREDLRISSALVVAAGLKEDEQLDPDLHESVLRSGLTRAQERGITGKHVTPFLLDHFHRSTHGQSLEVNERIIVQNAEIASRIAVAYHLST